MLNYKNERKNLIFIANAKKRRMTFFKYTKKNQIFQTIHVTRLK